MYVDNISGSGVLCASGENSAGCTVVVGWKYLLRQSTKQRLVGQGDEIRSRWK
jgi:hypothetical protein